MSDKTTKKVGIGSTIAGGVASATSAIATGLGFTSSGIAAGSAAAGIQAGIGNVVAGSAFATAQSLGATGVFAALGVLGPIGLVAGGIFMLVDKLE
jgi:hypothetical protein